MTREDCKGLGLNDEQTEKVLAELGKATEAGKAAKNTLAAKDAEIAGLKQQIADRDADIEKLKTGAGDTAAVQKQLEELQAKYKADTDALEGKLKAQKEEYETARATEKFFSGVEFSSDLAREAAIARFTAKGFKRDGDAFEGGKEWLEQLRKDSPESFKAAKQEDPEPNDPKPIFTRSFGGADPKGGKPEVPTLF